MKAVVLIISLLIISMPSSKIDDRDVIVLMFLTEEIECDNISRDNVYHYKVERYSDFSAAKVGYEEYKDMYKKPGDFFGIQVFYEGEYYYGEEYYIEYPRCQGKKARKVQLSSSYDSFDKAKSFVVNAKKYSNVRSSKVIASGKL